MTYEISPPPRLSRGALGSGHIFIDFNAVAGLVGDRVLAAAGDDWTVVYDQILSPCDIDAFAHGVRDVDVAGAAQLEPREEALV